MNDKIWLQQPNESNKNYLCFESFLNYKGILKNYVAQESANSDYSSNYLSKIAQKIIG